MESSMEQDPMRSPRPTTTLDEAGETPSTTKRVLKRRRRAKTKSAEVARVFPPETRCFNPERQGNEVQHLVDPQYSPQDRKEICRMLSRQLELSRLLTWDELTAIGWQRLICGERHFKKCDEGSHLFAMLFGPSLTKQLGVIPKMQRMREIITTPGFQKFLAAQQRSFDGVKSRTYNLLASVQHKVSKTTTRIQLGAHARAMNTLVTELNQLIAEVGRTLFDHAYSDELKDTLIRRNMINGAFSHSYNPYTNAIQINLSDIDETGSKKLSDPNQLGAAGAPHVDEHDDPTRHTIVLMLSNHPQDWFPGRFCLMSLKLECTLETFGALLFSGVDAHCGLGEGKYADDLPLDSPLRYQPPTDVVLPQLPSGTPYLRMNGVLYPSKPLIFYENWAINPEFETDKGLAMFGNRETQAEWRVQRHVRELLEAPDETKSLPTPEQVVEKFGWQDPDTGDMLYPRVSVARACLSFDRNDDPAFEKLLTIAEKTQAGLNEKAILIPRGSADPDEPARKARKALMNRTRKKNNARKAQGLPEIKTEIPAPIPKSKRKPGDPPAALSKTYGDPTIWTD